VASWDRGTYPGGRTRGSADLDARAACQMPARPCQDLPAQRRYMTRNGCQIPPVLFFDAPVGLAAETREAGWKPEAARDLSDGFGRLSADGYHTGGGSVVEVSGCPRLPGSCRRARSAAFKLSMTRLQFIPCEHIIAGNKHAAR